MLSQNNVEEISNTIIKEDNIGELIKNLRRAYCIYHYIYICIYNLAIIYIKSQTGKN